MSTSLRKALSKHFKLVALKKFFTNNPDLGDLIWLETISKIQGCEYKKLAAFMMVSSSATSQKLDRLENLGYIIITRGKDARSRNVRLTHKGKGWLLMHQDQEITPNGKKTGLIA